MIGPWARLRLPQLARIAAITAGLALTAYAALFLKALFAFESNCGEDSRPVQEMRALPKDELAVLYGKVMGMREQYAEEILTRDSKPPIPADLAQLNAMRVWFGDSDGDVLVTLIKCNVSVGVNLRFRSAEGGHGKIELDWYEPTEGSRHSQRSEVLWSK